MSMRRQFVTTISKLLVIDPRVVLILCDIGVFGFRNALASFPTRVFNIGILEQGTVSVAAGLARIGCIPVVHSIAPFITERCLEQIKIDFGYQGLPGVFVTVGASYDYAALGCTHHCPADVQVVTSIPDLQVIVPGSAAEFDSLFVDCYLGPRPTYIRLSEAENERDWISPVGCARVVKVGSLATVVAIGTILDTVVKASEGLDVTVIYYSTVSPFDTKTLKSHVPSGKVLLCEPYYQGGLAAVIMETLWPKRILLRMVGVPRQFLRNYGKRDDHDASVGLTPVNIRQQLELLINA